MRACMLAGLHRVRLIPQSGLAQSPFMSIASLQMSIKEQLATSYQLEHHNRRFVR